MSETLILNKCALIEANYFAKERIIINQGGTASGKTYSILDLFFIIAMNNNNLVLTVVGQDIPNLKKGAYRDAKRIWSDSEIYQKAFSKPNETERIFTSISGSIIEFNAYQDEQDAKSGKRDYLFINEANGVDYNIFWQLQMRTRKKVYIDYNPTTRFWAHDLINDKDTKLIISDHRDNHFLSDEEHAKIEGIKDKELFKVYARGYTGKIEGLIYKNWVLTDTMPDDYKKRWIGLDFGFSNDPTTIVDVRLSNGELWIDEIEYRTGMLNSDIATLLQPYKAVEIIADSAEPKSIAEIKGYGYRIEGAVKGQDSIKNGIDILKRYTLNLTKRSTNIKRELMSYKWKDDKNGGLTNEPIDDFNHAMDAIRYVALNKLNQSYKPKGVIHATF